MANINDDSEGLTYVWLGGGSQANDRNCNIKLPLSEDTAQISAQSYDTLHPLCFLVLGILANLLNRHWAFACTRKSKWLSQANQSTQKILDHDAVW